ncbi:unnamed protein product [Dimorphilus gyrociliatus]|uniref:Uncharacterized protein n=1 Tax=Dimorphilus gyrociliatus TaxID=2664684 RepID=A0A7I8WBV3_9ANNE|nr:unnamed protein product [Dimorphilus gyrociliatus]
MEERLLERLKSSNFATATDILAKINLDFAQCMSFAPDTKSLRTSVAKFILSKLESLGCNDQVEFSTTALNTLRITCRDKTVLSGIEIDNVITTLFRYGQFLDQTEKNPEKLIIEAQKCLYNILHLSQSANEFCAAHGILDGIFSRIKNHEEYCGEIQKLDFIILFFVTAKCPRTRSSIAVETDYFAVLVKTLERLSYKNNFPKKRLTEEVDLICEILKLSFNGICNLNKKSTDINDSTKRFAITLRDLLLIKNAPETLISNVINAWTSMPISTYDTLVECCSTDAEKRISFEGKDLTAIQVILDFLQTRLDRCKLNENISIRDEVSPVMMSLVQFCRHQRYVRKYCRSIILPPMTTEVLTLPEEGNSFRNHLCRLLTHVCMEVCKLSTELLFVMCKERVSRFIKYTGYGNAAGKLAESGLLIPTNVKSENYSSESEDSDTEEYDQLKADINPVTGRVEEPREEVQMSDEQKEYEAMKLVDEIDKLMRRGIITPSVIGEDGRPQPAQHVSQLLDNIDVGRRARGENGNDSD